MKLVVSGSRDCTDYGTIWKHLNLAINKNDITEVLIGDCKGVDSITKSLMEKYYTKIPVRVFKADWNKHGKAAGPIRNAEMMAEGDILLAFPTSDSKGTRNCINIAEKMNKPCYVVDI